MMRIVIPVIVVCVPLLVSAVLWWVASTNNIAGSVLQLRVGVTTAIWSIGILLSLLLALALYLRYRNKKLVRNKVTDLTRQNKLEQQRFQQRLNHELKNPLTALNLSVENVLAQNTNSELSRDIDNIKSQSQRLSTLTGDLRKLHLFENQSLDCDQVDVGQLLSEVVELAREGGLVNHSDVNNRNVKLLVPEAPWPVPLVYADRDLLQLAFYNLIDNAVKYSQSGDTIEIQVTEDGDFVKIIIGDTGLGMAEDDVDQVFDELFRGKNARALTGSGIGLSLVKRIVERHSGSIFVDSKSGQGTRVSILLPQDDKSISVR